MSSEVRAARFSDIGQLAGGTPLFKLRNLGAGSLWVKHEGFGPGQSFYDRVARQQLQQLDAKRVVVVGASAHAVSVAMMGARQGISVEVLTTQGETRRLWELLMRYGARLTKNLDADSMSERLEGFKLEGVPVLRADEATALAAAFEEMVTEFLGQAPDELLLVSSDFGVKPELLLGGLASDTRKRITLVPDDSDGESELSDALARLRTELGCKEGILASPMDARTVSRALEIDGKVAALLPGSGHRFLGWW